MTVLEKVSAIGKIDIAQGMKTVANNEMIYLKLLGKLSALIEKSGNSLKSLNTDEQHNEIVFEAHTLKGAMYNLGVMGIGDVAKDIEFAAKEGNTSKINELLPEFLDVLFKFREDLTEALIK